MATKGALAIQQERDEAERASREKAQRDTIETLAARVESLEGKIDTLVAALTPKAQDKAEEKPKGK